MAKQRHRITVDVTEIYERLKRWGDEPKQSTGSIIRSVLVVGLEFLESLEKLGLGKPRSGTILEWLQGLMNKEKQHNAEPKTIGELLRYKLKERQLTPDQLSSAYYIPVARLNEILGGKKPEHGELSLLAHFLQKSMEELKQMCKDEFNGNGHSKQEVHNG